MLVEGGSKTLLLPPHTVYFLPDDSGLGLIFISVFVVLLSKKDSLNISGQYNLKKLTSGLI